MFLQTLLTVDSQLGCVSLYTADYLVRPSLEAGVAALAIAPLFMHHSAATRLRYLGSLPAEIKQGFPPS